MSTNKTSLTIVADQNIHWVEHYFGDFGKVELISGRQLNNAHLRNADVLLVRSVTNVNATLLAGTSVKFVGSATIGTDHIDLDYLMSHGISFANAAGSNANSVVEYVLAALCQLVPQAGSFLDKTIGIIGAGNVGSKLARQLQTLGMRVKCYDPLIQLPKDLPACTFDQALNSDIISLHTPLTFKDSGEHATFHLMGQDRLSQLQAGTTLINTCRGAVIDTRALLKRLQQHNDLHVALDVWEDEPNISKTLLESVALGTPHIAGYSVDGKIRATKMLYDAFCKFQGFYEVDRSEDILPGLPKGFYGRQNNGYPINNRQCINISEKLSELELLCKVIGEAYRISDDHQDLLTAMAAKFNDKGGEAFDELRNHYPNRYEWHNVNIHLNSELKNQSTYLDELMAFLDKLRALGFTMTLP